MATTASYGNGEAAPVLVHTTNEGEGDRCNPGITPPHIRRGPGLEALLKRHRVPVHVGMANAMLTYSYLTETRSGGRQAIGLVSSSRRNTTSLTSDSPP